MENKKNNNFLIIILLILVLGLVGFIIYDKIFVVGSIAENNNKNNSNNMGDSTNETNEDDLKELKKLGQFSSYSKEEIELWFENNYLSLFPKMYTDGHMTSFQVSQLTDEEISIFVWDYIYHHATLKENDNQVTTMKMQKSLVDSYLKKMFNMRNYDVKTLKDNYPSQPRLLIKESDYYIASMPQLYLGIEMFYRVTDINYNASTLEVLVEFATYTHGADRDYVQDRGVAILKQNTEDNAFYLESVEIK